MRLPFTVEQVDNSDVSTTLQGFLCTVVFIFSEQACQKYKRYYVAGITCYRVSWATHYLGRQEVNKYYNGGVPFVWRLYFRRRLDELDALLFHAESSTCSIGMSLSSETYVLHAAHHWQTWSTSLVRHGRLNVCLCRGFLIQR